LKNPGYAPEKSTSENSPLSGVRNLICKTWRVLVLTQKIFEAKALSLQYAQV